jgi:hypothetical protein
MEEAWEINRRTGSAANDKNSQIRAGNSSPLSPGFRSPQAGLWEGKRETGIPCLFFHKPKPIVRANPIPPG